VNITSDITLISLVQQASVLVQMVMGLLLLVSLLSWSYIFSKMMTLAKARRQTSKFEEEFWAASDIATLYQRASSRPDNVGALERIFESGYREFLRHRKSGTLESAAVTSGVQRAMKATFQREQDRLEAHLAFLATVGSVSPYVGLFGTVWGIMNAFRGLANVGQATLAHVAPGIAEALVATAMGLFAAIPAVVAYNRYAHDADRLASRFESFMEEFSNILQRQFKPTGR
jgi:Cell division and transport-associated protein TolQ (TC 2.C.1.2.1)